MPSAYSRIVAGCLRISPPLSRIHGVEIRHTLALSNTFFPRVLRKCRNWLRCFAIPAPRILVVPLLAVFLAFRSVYYFLVRVLFCEPLFKAYCTSYGHDFHTGVYLHWVQGRGKIIIGDHVLIDGKCSLSFAARYTAEPTLIIGDHSVISHACSLTVGRMVSIGRHCRIAENVWIFDSPGHPADPADRLADEPLESAEVKPVTIKDNVWIGQRAIIMPGVTIGEGSIVGGGSVVMSDVPANTMVAGNPARQFRKLIASQRPSRT